jgi:hypothetical protein
MNAGKMALLSSPTSFVLQFSSLEAFEYRKYCCFEVERRKKAEASFKAHQTQRKKLPDSGGMRL